MSADDAGGAARLFRGGLGLAAGGGAVTAAAALGGWFAGGGVGLVGGGLGLAAGRGAATAAAAMGGVVGGARLCARAAGGDGCADSAGGAVGCSTAFGGISSTKPAAKRLPAETAPTIATAARNGRPPISNAGNQRRGA